MDYAELKEEMKNAMKAKDKDRLAIIRQVKGDVDATVKDEGRDEVTEQDVTASLKRTLKQARETHEASVKAGTDEERTQRLAAQIEILEGMLPAQLEGAQLEGAGRADHRADRCHLAARYGQGHGRAHRGDQRQFRQGRRCGIREGEARLAGSAGWRACGETVRRLLAARPPPLRMR